MLMRTPFPMLRGATAGNRPWTAAEREKLAELYTREPRTSVRLIAEKLGRTESAVGTGASRMGLSGAGVELRRCIPCQRMFHSSWIGNRNCPRCEAMIAECA